MSKGFQAVPPTNRGTKRQSGLELGIDWLQFVLFLPSLAHLDQFCEFVFGGMQDEWVLRPGERYFCGIPWENWGQSTRGGRIYWNSDGKVLVILSSKVLRHNDISDVCTLIVGLVHSWAAKFTRLDACLDDYEKRLAPELFAQAIKDKDYFGVRKGLPYCPQDNGGKDLGFCYYFGSKLADYLGRYYNKFIESGGLIDAYRFEGQFRDERAHGVALALAEAMHEELTLAQVMASFILGAVDFRDRSVSNRVDRAPRLAWWQDFLDQVDAFPLKLSVSRPIATLQKSIDSMRRQCKKYARIAAAYGRDFVHQLLDELIDIGEKAFTAIDYKLIKAARDLENLLHTTVDNRCMQC